MRSATIALLIGLAACSEDPAPGPTDQASSGTSGKGSTSSSSGGASSSSGTSGSSTTSSGNTAPPLPAEVTVTAPLAGGLKATHAESADKKQLGSLLTVKGTPTITPAPPNGAFPSLVDGKVELVTPKPNACVPKFAFTMNPTEIAVVINGVDDVAKNKDCSKFTDDVAKDGLQVIVTEAAWSNVPEGTTAKPKVTVKFD